LSGELRGWHPDPFGLHEFRFFSDDGKPTLLVRDGSTRSYDRPPPGGIPLQSIESQPVEPAREPPLPSPPPLAAFEVRERPLPNGHADTRSRRPEPVVVTRPVDPVRQLSPPMSGPTKYAFIVVLAAMTVSALILAVMHLESHGSSHGAASASSTSTSTSTPPAVTATGGTTATAALPVALKPTAAAAAAAFISSWAAGNQAQASSVATSSAVATLFAGRYTPGLVIDRGCSVAFPPIVCTYGPPGGAAPTDAIYQIDVIQALGGWYVSSVKIDN
jgi:hypothetical protein